MDGGRHLGGQSQQQNANRTFVMMKTRKIQEEWMYNRRPRMKCRNNDTDEKAVGTHSICNLGLKVMCLFDRQSSF